MAHQLFKEAEDRLGQIRNTLPMTKHAGQHFAFAQALLLKEANQKHNKLKHFAALEKGAMAYYQGQKDFINSNVTWSKIDSTAHSEAIDAQMIEAFSPYFQNLINGKQTAIVPPQLVLRYEATRDLFPVVDENDPDTQTSYNDAINTIKVIENLVNGFQDFVQDVDKADFPMQMYFHSSDRDEQHGGFQSQDLTNFVKSEHQRHAQQPMKFGGMDMSKGYYSAHARAENIMPTMSSKDNRQYELGEIDRETSKSKISRWIAYAYQNGYQLNFKSLADEIRTIEQHHLQKNKLNTSNLNQKQMEWKQSIVHYYSGRNLQNPQQPVAPSSMFGRISMAIRYGCGPMNQDPNKKNRLQHWGPDANDEYMRGLPSEKQLNNNEVSEKACPNLTIQELRLIGKHMIGESVMAPAGTYVVPEETTTYNANGFDSRPDDPNQSMLVVPAIKKLPTGQMVYDKDQGNLMGNHLRKYGKTFESFLRKWGPWAENAMKILKQDKAGSTLRKYAQDHFQEMEANESAPDAIVPFDSWNTIMNNRTNADNVLETVQKHQTYQSLVDNVVKKTLASAITNYNYYTGSGVDSKGENAKYNPTGRFSTVQPGKLSGDNIIPQIDQWVAKIQAVVDQAGQDRNALKQIKQDVSEMAYNLSKTHQQDPRGFSWDQYSLAMSKLGDIKTGSGNSIVKNLNSIGSEDEQQMLSQQGFPIYQKYGYPVAKMLDLLSCIMIRSCNDSNESRVSKKTGETIPEEHYGTNYSSGTGKAGSTKLMFGVRYAFRGAELGSDDQQLLRAMRKERSKRKMKVPPTGVDVSPQTLHPQKGTEIDETFQNAEGVNPGGRIIEEITYWVGQASGSAGFHKGLDEGDGGLQIKGKSWREVTDYVERQYPQLISQLGLVFEPVNVDLKRLQEATKRSIAAVIQNMDVDAIFEDQDGHKSPIIPEEVQEDFALADQAKTVMEQNRVETKPASPDEQPPVTPVQEEPQAEEQQLPNEAAPEVDVPGQSISDDQIRHLIDQIWDESESSENAADIMKALETVDKNIRTRTIDNNRAWSDLQQIQTSMQTEERNLADQAEHGLMMLWEEKLGNPGGMTESEEVGLEREIERIKQYTARKGIPLPPNLHNFVIEQQQLNQEMEQYRNKQKQEVGFGPGGYNPDEDDDNYMPMKSMMAESQTLPGNNKPFINKRKTTRNLIMHRPDPGTGKLRKSDVINTLIKTADRMDDSGEYLLADKIDLLVNRMMKEDNV